jgi:hypothetical protein
MKLEPGKHYYYSPNRTGIVSGAMLSIDESEYFRLELVSKTTMLNIINDERERNKTKTFAQPLYVASFGEVIAVWPAPDKAYDLTVDVQAFL